jgi:glycosyltransferase involved in cell wall biosynthesis
LVLPSRSRPNWTEQFGRILIEAMGSGVPVIGSDAGEIPNVIGDAGQIYPEGDVDALRTHLHALMTDPDRWMIYAQLGCDRAQTHYSQRKVASDTVEAYRETLALAAPGADTAST